MLFPSLPPPSQSSSEEKRIERAVENETVASSHSLSSQSPSHLNHPFNQLPPLSSLSATRGPLTAGAVSFDVELIEELKCPICLDIMSDVMVTWCLHRYCRHCIERHLRGSNKDCPSCRVHIKSRRDLRSDVRMDSLIRTVFGVRRKAVEEEEEEDPAQVRRKRLRDDNGHSCSDDSDG